MATPFPFTAGQVLTAAQMNSITELVINDKTDSYTLVAGDAGERVIMNKATATTLTVPNSVFTAGQVVYIANKGAGVCTITAGVGTTVNVSGSLALAQYGGGTLLALSASSFIFFPAGGVSTLSVDALVVGGGGGGGLDAGASVGGGGGGGGGFQQFTSLIIGKSTYTVTVGGGGSGASSAGTDGGIGSPSYFLGTSVGGGGGSGRRINGRDGASGGGSSFTTVLGLGISGQGNNGGTGTSSPSYGAGGGGGAGGAGGNGSTTVGGAGGAASTNSYTGSSISYSGGGGGGIGSGTGGTGGTNAGNGGVNSAGGNGTANRGGGGGGSGGTGNGGNGGSGQVVIRYLTADASAFTVTASGGTSSTSGSYTIWTFTSTGSLTVA